jgi:hypothetical protein
VDGHTDPSWLSTDAQQVLEVYVVFSGPLGRGAVLWAAVCYAGPCAALSHQTAAELHKITDRPSELIHVTIPADRRVDPAPDLVIHHSGRIEAATHPALLPPRTRMVETVLDLVAQARTFDDAFGLVSAACQRRLTTADLVMEAMNARKRIRWRAEMAMALGDIGAGTHSILEYRYLNRVERAHGLPLATRQAHLHADRRNRYLEDPTRSTDSASSWTVIKRIRRTSGGRTCAGSTPLPRKGW